jgi:hypothetical protein
MTAAFVTTSAISYVVFAQFPSLLRDVAHVSDAQAGALLLLAPTWSPLLWIILVAIAPAYFPYSLASSPRGPAPTPARSR